MAMMPLTPGSSPQFTATPQPVPLPDGVIPTWSISPAAAGMVSADPTGLVATVAIASTAAPGMNFVLGVQASMPDGTTPNGSLALTVVAAMVETTSFDIVQTA